MEQVPVVLVVLPVVRQGELMIGGNIRAQARSQTRMLQVVVLLDINNNQRMGGKDRLGLRDLSVDRDRQADPVHTRVTLPLTSGPFLSLVRHLLDNNSNNNMHNIEERQINQQICLESDSRMVVPKTLL